MKILYFIIGILTLSNALGEPNPPIWSENIYVLDPRTPGRSQQIINQAFVTNGGRYPSFHGQFHKDRFALLFKPGYHDVNINLGYYTSVIGLGQAPSDVHIKRITCENGDFNFTLGALQNFWRSAEGFSTSPDDHMLWAVSQAAPLRRALISSGLELYQYNSGCCAGYASGGYMADVTVTGTIVSGSQQQWFTRNSDIGQWAGGLWNMVFLGNSGDQPQSHCGLVGSQPAYTSIEKTPVIAEKPYLVLQEDGKYHIAVPPIKWDHVGPTTDYNDAESIDLEDVYVAKPSDTAAFINSKLDEGLHLILAAGIYSLEDSLKINFPDTIVLGLGYPTLIASNGRPCIVVANVEGVRIAGLLLDAGPLPTPTLLQWGITKNAGSALNPGFAYDIFCRVGGSNDPKTQQVMVDTMVEVNSGHVVLDHLWLWRADHDETGLVYDRMNPNKHGIVVNGDNVKAYGLFCEHQIEDLTVWNGENGEVYFYQSELPYDVTQENFGDPGYVGYRVSDHVRKHKGMGIGVYSFFRDHAVIVENGIKSPPSPEISFTNSLSVFLDGKGQISHTINGLGIPVDEVGEQQWVCEA